MSSPDPRASAYLTRLRTERGCSPHTLDAYRRDLAELARLCEGRPWSSLDEAALRRWIAARVRSGAAPRSIARRLFNQTPLRRIDPTRRWGIPVVHRRD